MKEREFVRDLVRRFSALVMSMVMLHTALPVLADEEETQALTPDASAVYYDPDA